jgi:hypothetical protein
MVSEKAMYWVAAIVMTIGLSHSWMSHQFSGTALSNRVAARLQGLAVLGDRIAGRGDALAARAQARVERTQASMDRVQSRVDCVQVELEQRQVEMARRQAEMLRRQTDVVRSMVIRVPNPQPFVYSRTPKITVTVPEVSPEIHLPDDDTI